MLFLYHSTRAKILPSLAVQFLALNQQIIYRASAPAQSLFSCKYEINLKAPMSNLMVCILVWLCDNKRVWSSIQSSKKGFAGKKCVFMSFDVSVGCGEIKKCVKNFFKLLQKLEKNVMIMAN